ncbi:hypothetical protein SMACR_01452 [Sordaria macrospora]|uniref:Uncharacterized protein n=1 Tax=Sordaria macrospora TaxID=5147 RepID=A0A8S8ZNG1_SORMA|nr:hypothetical protein SMACR_01452 [Sordaria macrospora]WPJ58666.1 hypothetical protein SMAC4_01452 [Sordaria macrospora]
MEESFPWRPHGCRLPFPSRPTHQQGTLCRKGLSPSSRTPLPCQSIVRHLVRSRCPCGVVFEHQQPFCLSRIDTSVNHC